MAEAVYKETCIMNEGSCSEVTFNITVKTCYHCGNADHVAANCKLKAAKYNVCQKTGHQARVFKAKNKYKWVMRGDTKQSKADATKEKMRCTP